LLSSVDFFGRSPAGKPCRGGLFTQTFLLRKKVTVAIPNAGRVGFITMLFFFHFPPDYAIFFFA
jgi:hypothetical protein